MSSNHPIHIFIVEDNKVFQLALKSEIETSFAEKNVCIHSFDTGEDCMKKFEEIKPQVVILDYNLNSSNPKALDGIKILDLLKAERPDTNVIMLTSIDDIDIAVKSFMHGASDYVVKSETKFKKINYSLANLFELMEAKNIGKNFKKIAIGLFVFIVLLVGSVVITQIFHPSSL